MATPTQINDRATNLSFKKLSGYQYTSNSRNSFEEQGAAPFKLHAKHVWTTDIPASPIFAMADILLPGYKAVNGISLTINNQTKTYNYNTKPKELENALIDLFSDTSKYAATAWTDDFSFRRKEFVLTNVATVGATAWLIGRFNSATGEYELGETIDDNFIESNGYIGTQFGTNYSARLFVGAKEIPTGVDWNFDYDTGILTFLTTSLKALDNSTVTVTASSTVKVLCYKYIGQLGTESAGEPYDDVLGNFIIEPNANYTRKTGQTITTVSHINTFEAGN